MTQKRYAFTTAKVVLYVLPFYVAALIKQELCIANKLANFLAIQGTYFSSAAIAVEPD